MALSHVLSDNKRRVYKAAETILMSRGQYKVNDPVGAKSSGKLNIRMSESSLVSIIPLSSNTTDYQMNVVDNQGANAGNSGILPMEKRLPLQDAFFTSSFGFFLCEYNVALNASGAPVYPQIHFQFWTNPVPGIGGVGGVVDLAALLGIWATGRMEFKVGGETAVPDWWLQRHAVVNQTQSVFASASPNPFWDQQNYSDDGYLPTDPMWIINGANLNQFIIKYGSDWNQVWANNPLLNTASGAQLGIAVVWNGWQAQNASSIMNNQPQL